jgi:glyoxylase-like metal-dependent hydrolase (beta-lactamase superfamily II)
MSGAQAPQPKLANLVLSGEAQTEAVQITPFVFMARDISNSYLVTTSDGDVVINTGMPDGAERSVALFAPHRTGPLRYIILTQSHADHFGGVPTFREAGTQVVGGPGYVEARDDMMGLQPFFGARTFKLWGATLKRDTPPRPIPQVTPDIFVDRELTIEVGERTFRLISAPEGETEDNIVVWMPKEKIVFTGNTFGPVWLSMPFLNTLRGDKPRRVREYLKSLAKVRDLGAEMVITGHGEPIVGKDRIRADLDRMEAAVRYVRDYTLEGMKAGRTVHRLMAEFAFPGPSPSASSTARRPGRSRPSGASIRAGSITRTARPSFTACRVRASMPTSPNWPAGPTGWPNARAPGLPPASRSKRCTWSRSRWAPSRATAPRWASSARPRSGCSNSRARAISARRCGCARRSPRWTRRSKGRAHQAKGASPVSIIRTRSACPLAPVLA